MTKAQIRVWPGTGALKKEGRDRSNSANVSRIGEANALAFYLGQGG